jgi:hypothetical protein
LSLPTLEKPMKLINQDWLSYAILTGEQVVRLLLLDYDIESALVSLKDYRSAQNQLNQLTQTQADVQVPLIHLQHYAKSFVCAMRRAGRVLESLSANRSIYPKPVANTVKRVWGKKKSMFDSYIDPRNAIEHINGEILGKNSWRLLNLHNDTLFVTEDKSAEISEKNLQSAIEARNEIIESIIQHMPAPPAIPELA